jgi:anti-sigma B factor antagonist
MESSSRVVRGITILTVGGRLVTGSMPSLHDLVSELIANRRSGVVVCMAGVTDMDAHGIGELVSSLTTVERHAGRMALVAPSARVRRLLTLTRVDTVVTIYDSETDALEWICPAVPAVPMWREQVDCHLAIQPFV